MSAFSFVRRRALSATCVLAVGTVLTVHPTLARAIGVDVWNVPALNAELRATTEESGRLDAEDGDVRHRIAVKETLVAELIAGRASLDEVTDRFVALDATRPANLAAVRDKFPGDTDHEKMARNVIAYALPRATAHQRAALAHRLDTELRQSLAAGASR